MAFPYVFESNFERGTNGDWDTETDTASQLDFPHYSVLARQPWAKWQPYTGAYVARWTLSGGTADATLTEADINIADAATNWFRMEIMFAPDFDATADDTVALLELKGAAAAVTVAFGFRYVAATDVINFGVGGAASGAVPDNWGSTPVKKGVWYTCELKVVIQTGGSGTIDLYLTEDGDRQATSAEASDATLTNIVVTDGVLGVQNHLATTTGQILINSFVQDDAQLGVRPRYAINPIVTQSEHVFVGRGWINGAALLTDETSGQMTIYDTDTADTTSVDHYEVFFDIDNQKSIGGEIFFEKGCYVSLSGTSPKGQVMLVQNSQTSGVFGPLTHNDTRKKHYAIYGRRV